jgi:tail sheath protein
MAGGAWSSVSIGQGRPGLFINFVPVALAAASPGAMGIVSSIVKAPWGPDSKVQAIYNENDLLNYYTNSDTSPYNAWYEGHHAFLGGARQLQLYRIEGAGAAKGAHTFVDTAGTPANIFTIAGKYNGVYGNGFSIALQANPVVTTATDLLVYRSSTLLATYTTSVTPRGTAGHIAELVALVNADPNNFWVTATLVAEGTSTPASIAAPGTSLAGGSDGAAPLAADYTAGMTALEATPFDVFHADVLDADITGITASIKSWINGMRAYGKYVSWVVGSNTGETLATAQTNAIGYNNPAIVYWYPGAYELNNAGVRTLYRGNAYAAVIAGMYSALNPGQDMTYNPLPNILDLEVRLNNTQVTTGLANGLMLGTFDGIQFKIEEAINTLYKPGTGQGPAWQDVQSINTMDSLATAIQAAANATYIGKVPNDSVGQQALISAVRDFLRSMANSRAIATDFQVGLDTNPNYVSTGKNVFLKLAIRPITSMRFIYFTVQVG